MWKFAPNIFSVALELLAIVKPYNKSSCRHYQISNNKKGTTTMGCGQITIKPGVKWTIWLISLSMFEYKEYWKHRHVMIGWFCYQTLQNQHHISATVGILMNCLFHVLYGKYLINNMPRSGFSLKMP